MNKITLWTGLAFAALMVGGCSSPAEEAAKQHRVEQHNKQELAAPMHMGTISNGIELFRMQILHHRPNFSNPEEHWVYFTSAGEITTNWRVQHGKTMVNQTAASLNIQPNMTAEEVLSVAQKAIQEQEQQERAELARLLQKYGNQ